LAAIGTNTIDDWWWWRQQRRLPQHRGPATKKGRWHKCVLILNTRDIGPLKWSYP